MIGIKDKGREVEVETEIEVEALIVVEKEVLIVLIVLIALIIQTIPLNKVLFHLIFKFLSKQKELTFLK